MARDVSSRRRSRCLKRGNARSAAFLAGWQRRQEPCVLENPNAPLTTSLAIREGKEAKEDNARSHQRTCCLSYSSP